MHKDFTFEYINDQLLNLGAVHSASELQGMLCGLVSAGLTLSDSEWITRASKFLDIEHIVLNESQNELLGFLLKESVSQLESDHYGFSPLLPSDQVEIFRRAEELGAWCGGFLHGLGVVLGAREDEKLSPDVADSMRDLANITQVAVDESDDLEENETYWVELVEYVKVAVLTIFSELKNKPATTVH